jgi:hypothetical protein
MNKRASHITAAYHATNKPVEDINISEVAGAMDDFRTFNWVEVVEYPEALMDKTQKLLGIAA